jgi:membrane-bound lytic murein transglycosylase D
MLDECENGKEICMRLIWKLFLLVLCSLLLSNCTYISSLGVLQEKKAVKKSGITEESPIAESEGSISKSLNGGETPQTHGEEVLSSKGEKITPSPEEQKPPGERKILSSVDEDLSPGEDQIHSAKESDASHERGNPQSEEGETQPSKEEGDSFKEVSGTTTEDPEPIPSETPQITNQELLDSALDYCLASTDFWERGDLDNAIDALDKAYSLILKVNQDDTAEVLQQKEDLRFTISRRIIEVYASRFTVVNGDHKAIPLVMNRHVQRALEMFTGREKRFFLGAYRRSGRYRPAIVKALREEGLPEELSWLPLIESGFKVRALSRARALGLWQFIASTGYKFGLRRDLYIDERMDPEKSTKAAIAFLKELHRIFGDWTTALAAYNCGPLNVLKSIRKQKINYLDNFWDLYARLPRETAFYVPKFLAVLHILNDPQAHGMTLPPVDEEMQSEKVAINKSVHLKTIARRLDLEYTSMRDLNPELRHNVTPKTPYLLKVPIGKGEILLAEMKNIPVWQPPVPPYIVHRVRYGESLSVIADRYNTSVRSIMAMNGLRRRDFVRAGWRLKIPTKKAYVSRAKKAPVYYASITKGESIKYVVKKGDSLYTIANYYRTTTESIRSLNRLHSSTLRIGQVLIISPGITISKPDNTKTYTVRSGDSPYIIARKHRMNLAQFLRLNNLTPRSTIFPGQIVIVKAE